MAGLTDQAFRNLCRDQGAAMAVSEMTTADIRLWNSPKSRSRLQLDGENGLKIVQIAGTEPEQMAEAAGAVALRGVDIIDINMGCPAKKVCNKLAGSALMKDEGLVREILDAVVSATELPVTLKIRTGWDEQHKNAPLIAAIAEEAGIKSLTVHGRTREGMFKTDAEYDTIRDIRNAVSIPVIANGDIDSPLKALEVLHHTGANAVMIGRGALGRPWIFGQINTFLESHDETVALNSDRVKNDQNVAERLPATAVRDIMVTHLTALHRLHGDHRGVRLGRKHLTWYCKYLEGAEEFRKTIVRVESAAAQLQLTKAFFAEHQFS